MLSLVDVFQKWHFFEFINGRRQGQGDGESRSENAPAWWQRANLRFFTDPFQQVVMYQIAKMNQSQIRRCSRDSVDTNDKTPFSVPTTQRGGDLSYKKSLFLTPECSPRLQNAGIQLYISRCFNRCHAANTPISVFLASLVGRRLPVRNRPQANDVSPSMLEARSLRCSSSLLRLFHTL